MRLGRSAYGSSGTAVVAVALHGSNSGCRKHKATAAAQRQAEAVGDEESHISTDRDTVRDTGYKDTGAEGSRPVPCE